MAALLATYVALLLPNMASPIYPLWQEEMGFSPAVISVLFAVYPAGVLVSLFGVVRLLRHTGWLKGLLVGTGLAFTGAVLLVVADGPVLLGVSRFITGISTGICLSLGASTMSAVLERRGTPNAPRIAAIVLSAGFGSGPLIGGLVADHASRPTVAVFEFEAVALVVVAVLLLLDPGLRTIDDYQRSATAAAAPGRMPLLPKADRRVALLTATWVFVACGIACAVFQALGSAYLKDLVGDGSATFSGLLVSLVFGSAFAGQVAMAAASTRAQAWTALTAGGVGSVLLLAGIMADSVPALFAAASLAGASQGLGQAVGITVARQTTELGRLPGVLSKLNILAYGLAGGSIFASSPLVAVAGVAVAIAVIAGAVLALTTVALLMLARWHGSFGPASAGPSSPRDLQEGADDAVCALGPERP